MKRTVTKMEKTTTKMPSLTKVAAYARVSSGKEEMLHSLLRRLVITAIIFKSTRAGSMPVFMQMKH